MGNGSGSDRGKLATGVAASERGVIGSAIRRKNTRRARVPSPASSRCRVARVEGSPRLE